MSQSEVMKGILQILSSTFVIYFTYDYSHELNQEMNLGKISVITFPRPFVLYAN